jgi:hypothetical protein
MIPPQAAALAIEIAKGVIKLTKRIDLVLAEKEAVEGPLALPVPAVGLMPGKGRMRKVLRDLLAETKEHDPDPLGPDREAIAEVVGAGAASEKTALFAFVKLYAPKVANERHLDLDASFMVALKAARPEMAADPDLAIAAFYVSSGSDVRNKSYTWRLALTVVDVVAEFGGENAALFTRDERMQGVVSAVLRRFGEADVDKTDSTRELLHAALSATLNGALDARGKLGVENDWLEAVLDALVKARDSVPKEQQANFLLGLVRGEGYPALVASVLEVAAGRINADEVVNFKDLAADFLVRVAGIVKQKEDFEGFFQDHWGDLLRAGLLAAEKNGPALLGDEKLLGTILGRVAGDLAKQPNNRLLSSEVLFGIVNSVAAAAAANPEEIEELLGPNKRWLSALIGSVTGTVADRGIRKTFTQQGVTVLFQDTFAVFAEQPELLVKDNELAGALVGGVLKELSAVEAFGVQDLASAALGGALSGLAANPGVLEFEYSEGVASFAGRVGTLVAEKKLTGVQGRDILGAVTASFAENPQLFLDLELKLAEMVVAAVTHAAQDRPAALVAGVTLTATVGEVVSALGRSGRAALKNHPAAEMVGQLEAVVAAGLSRGEVELGHRIGLPSLPATIGMLVEAWAQGKVAQLDPDNANFQKLFSELADRAAA